RGPPIWPVVGPRSARPTLPMPLLPEVYHLLGEVVIMDATPSSIREPTMSGEPIGKFQVISTLGQGAHSTILHIRRSADAREYALKVVQINGKEDQKYLDQAQHEIRVAQMLDHANLLKVYTLETESDWLFRVRKVNLLIEYVKGLTLDKVEGLSLAHLVQI